VTFSARSGPRWPPKVGGMSTSHEISQTMTKAKTSCSTAVSTAVYAVLTVPMKVTLTPMKVLPSNVANTPINTNGNT
jgi:hypothetical protein